MPTDEFPFSFSTIARAHIRPEFGPLPPFLDNPDRHVRVAPITADQ